MATPSDKVKVILRIAAVDKETGAKYGMGSLVELTDYVASILVAKGHAELVEGEELSVKPKPKPVKKLAGTPPVELKHVVPTAAKAKPAPAKKKAAK